MFWNAIKEGLIVFALKHRKALLKDTIMDDFDDGLQSGGLHMIDLFMYHLIGQQEWEDAKEDADDTKRTE